MNKYTTILIVDDDPDDRELFVEAVTEIDPSVVCDTSPGSLEALELLKKASIIPDYIFLDLNMPRMNGIECLAEMKKLSHLNNAVLIVYTTSERPEDIKEMLASGATHFLIKPTSFTHLQKAIRHIISEGSEEESIEGLFTLK